MSEPVLIYVPRDQAATPANGECIVDHWWTVHPEKGLVFWARVSGHMRSDNVAPQCNSSESTCRLLSKKLYPDCTVEQIPVVFLEHAERQLREIRK